MKPITFLGDSRARIRDFPDGAKARIGLELYAVQTGRDPSDWKPMKTIGAGVREIRIRERSGVFRVLYFAAQADQVLVLHAFQKKEPANLIAGPSACGAAAEGVAGGRKMKAETFDTVFDALADSEEEAVNMRVRAELLLSIRERVESWALSQDQAASRLGITRPRLNDLLRGKLRKFSLDALVNIAAAAKLAVEIKVMEAA